MKSLILPLLLLMLSSCTLNKIDSGLCTRIDLDKDDDISVFDLFSEVEIIPLETNDSSILADVSRYEIWDDTLYILDKQQDDVFMFKMDGEFIRRLGHKGNGPNEYVGIEDMNINRFTGNLEILSTDGRIILYNSGNGTFLSQITLPNYFIHSFQNVSSNIDVFYFNSEKNDALQLYDRKEKKIIASAWKIPKSLSFTGFLPLKPFYIYNDSVYLYKGYSGESFSVLPQYPLLLPHHLWDFGEYTFDVNSVPIAKDWKYYHNLYMNGSANQALGFVLCAENDCYHMTQFRYRNEDKILFYNKKTKEKKLFHEFKEGFGVTFRYVDNKYLTSICYYDYRFKSINPVVLDDKNHKRFLSIKEESNPFVIRYKFRL